MTLHVDRGVVRGVHHRARAVAVRPAGSARDRRRLVRPAADRAALHELEHAYRALREKDKFANYKHSLMKMMRSDPSHGVRVKAACQLASLLQMDRETLQ